jgi:DNA-binding MarR family transcriptional regulator
MGNHSTIKHSLSTQSLKKDLEERFNTLTSQEFLIFLTIYQLEEDFGKSVTYNDLSNKLSLTPGCIRGYVSSLIRKNLPILKSKINNRTLTLSINPNFKDLNLKQKLTNIYYDQDPDQTKLF